MKKLLTVLLIIVLAGGLVGGIGYMSDGFKDWNYKDWIKPSADVPGKDTPGKDTPDAEAPVKITKDDIESVTLNQYSGMLSSDYTAEIKAVSDLRVTPIVTLKNGEVLDMKYYNTRISAGANYCFNSFNEPFHDNTRYVTGTRYSYIEGIEYDNGDGMSVYFPPVNVRLFSELMVIPSYTYLDHNSLVINLGFSAVEFTILFKEMGYGSDDGPDSLFKFYNEFYKSTLKYGADYGDRVEKTFPAVVYEVYGDDFNYKFFANLYIK